MSNKMQRGTEKSIFLDGVEYTAADLYRLIGLLVGNGVYMNELAPTATNEDMSITHGAGHAWIGGVAYWNTTPFTLSIATADGSLNRYDSLMLRLDLSINEVYAVIIQGAYATNPTPPACTRNAETFDLKICDIYVPAGCTKITQDQITDTRLDSSVCGVPVFPVEHMDMTSFYRQIATDLANFQQKNEADFTAWVEDQQETNLATMAALVEIVRNTSDESRAEILDLLAQLNNLVDSDAVGELITKINEKLSTAGGIMEGPINMNGKPITGLNDPTENTQAANKGYVDTAKAEAKEEAKEEANAYTDQQVRRAAPRNLLDNSNFRNPVNQRGSTSYTSVEYTIDRWRTWEAGTVTIAEEGLTNDVPLLQYLEKVDEDRIHTFSVGYADGSVSVISGIFSDAAESADLAFGVDLGNSLPYVKIFASGKTVQLAALYEGEYTADNLPNYQPKGYETELLGCMRYFNVAHMSYSPCGFGYGNGSQIKITVPIPVRLRVNPSVAYSGGKSIKDIVLTGGGEDITPSSIVASRENNNIGLTLSVSSCKNLHSYAMRSKSAFDIHFSADL